MLNETTKGVLNNRLFGMFNFDEISPFYFYTLYISTKIQSIIQIEHTIHLEFDYQKM